MGEEGVSEYLYKVLVVGDMGTGTASPGPLANLNPSFNIGASAIGKTAIIRRYVNNMYSDSYKSTVLCTSLCLS
jgi:hypothetical protein